MAEAYQTIRQELWYGDEGLLVEVGPVVTAAPIPSQLTTTRRAVLGSSYPRIAVARVDYRITPPQMLIGAESEMIRLNPKKIVALIQTDSNIALVMQAGVSGVPEQAASAGELVSTVTFQPRGPVYRCVAQSVSGGAAVVGDGEQAFAVVTDEGAGNITRGGRSYSTTTKALHDLGTTGASVNVPGSATAWILSGPRAGV